MLQENLFSMTPSLPPKLVKQRIKMEIHSDRAEPVGNESEWI